MVTVMKPWDYYTDVPSMDVTAECRGLILKLLNEVDTVRIAPRELQRSINFIFINKMKESSDNKRKASQLITEFVSDIQKEFNSHLMDADEYQQLDDLLGEIATDFIIKHRWSPHDAFASVEDLIKQLRERRERDHEPRLF